jgi:GT2 family glycosyltransferase
MKIQMIKKTDLSIIILTFNSEKFICGCIDSILQSENFGFGGTNKSKYKAEIIVVDNNSRDQTLDLLEKYPNIRVLPLKENRGFSYGNNRGFENSCGEFVLFLNPDAFVEKNTLYKVLDFVKGNDVCGGATCFVELVKSKSIDPASHRGFPTPWASLTYFLGLEKKFSKIALFTKYHLLEKNLSEIHEIDALSGTFFLTKRSVFLKAIMFDEAYFMYGEDLDLCYKIKNLGFKIYFYPFVKCYHYKGMSSGIVGETAKDSQASKEERSLAKESFYEAMKIFYKKHYENKYPRLLKYLVFLAIDFKKLLPLI